MAATLFFGITVEKNSVFWKRWFERGIYFVSDLLNSDGKFLSLDEFQKKYDLEVNFLHYFQLLAAIPLDLKRKAFDSPTPDLFSTSLEYTVGIPIPSNLQKYICSKTISGSYTYDVVWCGLEMIENKQKFVGIICSYKLQFITFINA